MIRIANGQGFWGDSLEAPVEQVRRGPIDYLTLDYLAEVTMSILQKQRSRDPKAGYARDFVDMIARVLPDLVERRIRVIANAGGVNPAACRDAILEVAKRQGIEIKVATVAGDDIMGRLDDFIARGVELKNMDTGEPLSTVRANVQSANVYFGAFPVVDALARGAQIVITGRVTDTGLALAPMIHEFGWKNDIGISSRRAPSPATRSNAARNAPAEIARWIGRQFPTWLTSATRLSRPNPTGRSVSPNTPEPAAALRWRA